MTIDALREYIVAQSGPFIAAHSTPDVPLVALTAGQVLAQFEQPAKKATVLLDPQEPSSEWLTMGSKVVRQPVDVYVFTQGAAEIVLRAQAREYRAALRACLAQHEEFADVQTGDEYDGVEGKPDIKAAKMTVTFEYEEEL